MPWFNEKCKRKKEQVLLLLSKAQLSSKAKKKYWDARKEYKGLLILLKNQYKEEKLLQKVEQTEVTPWSLFENKKERKPVPIDMEDLEHHFKNIFHTTARYEYNTSLLDNDEENENMWYNSPITSFEVQTAISQTPNRKAPGPDCIVYEHLKTSLNILLPYWVMILNLCLQTSKTPMMWHQSKLKIIYKGKGSKTSPDSYRGIALLCTPFKVLTWILNKRIFANIKHLLPDEQNGFFPGRSTIDPISTIINDILENMKQKKATYCCFIDFRKAFDSVNRSKLLKKIKEKFGVKGKTLLLIEEMLKNNEIYINNGTMTSEAIFQNIGILQGDSLSPTLFITFVTDLAESLRNDNIQRTTQLYADDTEFHSTYKSDIQNGLNALQIWCNENDVQVNTSKTKIMKFRKGGRVKQNDKFKYGTEDIEIVSAYEYLGVTLQTTLTFTEHIKKKKEKCYSIIGCLSPLQLISVTTALRIFEMKVLPIITYALHSFSSLLTVTHLKEIDKIKAAFFKQVLGLHRSASSTLSLHLVEQKTFVYDLQEKGYKFNLAALQEYNRYRHSREENFQNEKYHEGPAFKTSSWKGTNQKNRHLLTRATSHGFHHNICINKKYHNIQPNCKCKLCSQCIINRYHLLYCTEIKTIKEAAELL